MSASGWSQKPTTRRYIPEETEQAVRMVRTLRAELGTSQGTVKRVARQLGYGVESVRNWVRQAGIDSGEQPGVTTSEAARLKLLEQALGIAITQVHDDRPRLEHQLAGTDAKIRETTSAFDRYLRAFETGSMPDAVCAPRVEELAAQRQELTEYRNEVAAALQRPLCHRATA